MSKFFIDTKKTRQSGEDILKLTAELNEQINKLFSKISNVNTDANTNTLKWVGKSADKYVMIANKEKIQYTRFVKILNKYGQVLVDAADMYEKSIKKISDL